MRVDPLKASAILGDPTRYAIYQFITKPGNTLVTASEIAQQFSLHANVARMHLQKLEDLGLLRAVAAEKGGRGRPGMAYVPSGRAVAFSFPARDFELLADLMGDALAALGPQAYPLLSRAGKRYGRALADHVTAEARATQETLDFQEAALRTSAALESLGLEPIVSQRPDGGFNLGLHNCGFREAVTRHPELICHLCHEIVQGALEAHIGDPQITGEKSIPMGDDHCNYVLIDHIELPDGTVEKLENL